jgi:rhodanese-related sulfurtransferase
MQQISPKQLQEWLTQSQGGGRPRPLLLDVREPWELDVCRLPEVRPMPMRSVPARYAELDRDAEVVVICHHGARSFQVAMFLEQQGYTKVYNLHGGVAEWARQVEPTMATY